MDECPPSISLSLKRETQKAYFSLCIGWQESAEHLSNTYTVYMVNALLYSNEVKHAQWIRSLVLRLQKECVHCEYRRKEISLNA